MVAGPEVGRVFTEFEENTAAGDDTDLQEHDTAGRQHDQRPGVQAALLRECKSLTAVLQDLGNPFMEESQDLLVLDTNDIMHDSVVDAVRKVAILGQQKQYNQFVEERLIQCTKPPTDRLPKNKLPLFSTPPKQSPSKGKLQLASLKRDCNLFSRLYVACQTRDGDLDRFFSHENSAAPPSLSQGGMLRAGNKAVLMSCLEAEDTTTRYAPEVDAKVLDGPAVVTARTFQDYAEQVFAPHIASQLQNSSRIDIVWDVYMPESLKASTRQRRGRGTRRRVLPRRVSTIQKGGFVQEFRLENRSYPDVHDFCE